MTEQSRITSRPQVRGQQGAPTDNVVAQPHNYFSSLPAPNANLHGLVQGLAALNPALAQYGQEQAMEQGALVPKQREDGLVGSKAAVANLTEEGVRAASTGTPIAPPPDAPPAFAEAWRIGAAEGAAQRQAIMNKAAAITKYNDLKDTEGFDAKQFLAETRQEWLAGVADPRTQAILGSHFAELEGAFNAEAERARVQKVEAAREANVSAAFTDGITANMTPQEVAQAYNGTLLGVAKQNGQTPADAAKALLRQVTHVSNQAGGKPELFAAFGERDAEGMRLEDRNPALKPHIDQARQQAVAMRDKAIDDASRVSNTRIVDDIQRDIDEGRPELVTPERLESHMGSHGAINEGKYLSLMHQAREAQMKKLATQALMGSFDEGTLFRQESGVQNKVLDARLGPAMDQMIDGLKKGDPQAVAALATQVMQAHSHAGATVPWDQLKGWIQTNVTNLPSKEGPSSTFQAAASLFKTLSANPQYRSMYFNEDLTKVFEGYTAAAGSGTDPKVAYAQAYQAISPEAKAAAEAFTKTPDFQKLIKGDVAKYIEGSSWVPPLIGGNGRPQNVEYLGSEMTAEMRSWRARNMSASADQIATHEKEFLNKNFVLDTTTGNAVRVPPGLGGQATQEALSSYTAEVAKRLNLGSRNDAKWTVQLNPLGTEGDYQVVAFNGTQMVPVNNVSLGGDRGLLAQERAKKDLTDSDRAVLGAWKDGIKNGQVGPINETVFAKAQAMKLLSAGEVKAYHTAYEKAFTDRLASIPKFTLGDPSAAALTAPRNAGKVDNQLTATTALELLSGSKASYMGANFEHLGMASSLTTMGEAVALTAYKDPAKGAGMNIGMGYNLDANAKNANDDLRRSGVPPERIEDVKAGRASLTPDQAKRLLQVSLPRYEKQVQEVAEGTSPGLWGRMTQAQKAVMIDVAYQVGSTDKFKKAWSAVAAGDMKTFAEEAKVTYVNQAGQRVEDTRRNNLRAALLAGPSYWEASVRKFGAMPSTKLQAMTSTQ